MAGGLPAIAVDGRGPLAGPVVAAAAVFSIAAIKADCRSRCAMSTIKKLSARKRAKLFEALDVFDGVEFVIGGRGINILQATHKAMHGPWPPWPSADHLLSMGDRFRLLAQRKPHRQGRLLSYSIGAASIFAKVTRIA